MAGYVTSTHTLTEAYTKIQILAKNAKVRIEPSDDGGSKLVLCEKKRYPYALSVQDGTLTVKPTKTGWLHALRIGIDRSEIRLFVPQSTLEEIAIKSNVGRIDLHSVICNGTIEIETNTGALHASEIACKSFRSKGNTGSASLCKCSAQESISIKRNAGSVLLNDCTAPDTFIKTNTGRVGGKLPSHTVFSVRTNTGRVKTPQASMGKEIGGRCEIRTNTGSIKFE